LIYINTGCNPILISIEKTNGIRVLVLTYFNHGEDSDDLALAISKVLWILTLLFALKVPIPQIVCHDLTFLSLAHNRILHALIKYMEIGSLLCLSVGA